MTNFNEVWSGIYQRLAKGMQIRNWSNDGYTDKVTTIEAAYFQEILGFRRTWQGASLGFTRRIQEGL